jgi:hypothetical protein
MTIVQIVYSFHASFYIFYNFFQISSKKWGELNFRNIISSFKKNHHNARIQPYISNWMKVNPFLLTIVSCKARQRHPLWGSYGELNLSRTRGPSLGGGGITPSRQRFLTRHNPKVVPNLWIYIWGHPTVASRKACCSESLNLHFGVSSGCLPPRLFWISEFTFGGHPAVAGRGFCVPNRWIYIGGIRLLAQGCSESLINRRPNLWTLSLHAIWTSHITTKQNLIELNWIHPSWTVC